MTASRKELQKALRAAFHSVAEQQAQLTASIGARAASANNPASSTAGGGGEGGGGAALATGELLFEDYAPPAALLDAIDSYGSQSEVAGLGGQDREVNKLQEVLLEDCYNEGILTIHNDTSLQARARSAFILVLGRFAALDSAVVSPAEIRYVWWDRLLKPALLPYDDENESFNYGSKHTRDRDREKANLGHIRLGREAAAAAKEMLVKALCSTPTADKDSAKWRENLFASYFDAESGSFGRKSLEEVLVAFCRTHPLTFYTNIHSSLNSCPAHSLQLLVSSIRLAPLQAHQAINTPLFRALVDRLNGLSSSLDSVRDTRSADIVQVSLTLTALNMLLPRIPTHLDKQLDDLFLVLVRCLLWQAKAFSPRPRPDVVVPKPDTKDTIPAEAFDYDEDDADPERLQHVREPLPALLDYFTTLYGLFPANLLYFLTAPVQWLQSYARRQIRRQQRSSSSSISRGDDLKPPSVARARGAESSTSGGEDFPDLGEEVQDFGDGSDAEGLYRSGSLRRNAARKSKPHGKGRRSKLKKQKKDASTTAKKEKEALKQKERERRRRSANFLTASQDQSQPDEAGPEGSSGMVKQLSNSSISGAGDESVEASRVRIALPDESMQSAGYDESSTDSSALEDEDEDLGDDDVELGDALLRIDWDKVRSLIQVRAAPIEKTITAHAAKSAMLTSTS